MLISRLLPQLPIRSRILLALVGLVTMAIAVVVVVQDWRQREVLLHLEYERGLSIARYLAVAASKPLLIYNLVGLQELTDTAVLEEGVEYAIVLDREGTVAGFSDQPQRQGSVPKDDLTKKSIATSKILIQKESALYPGGGPGIDFAIPIYVEGSPDKWGTVRVGLSLRSMYAELDRTRAWGLGSGCAVLALAILVALLLTQRITGPLKRLVDATGELAKGNFDYRVGLETGDEIGDLSRKFDHMSSIIRKNQLEVKRTNDQLASLNLNLEEKVRERTRAVAEAEEKYRLLVEQSPNAICIIQNGELKFFNQTFCQTFGYLSKELSAKSWVFVDLLDPDQNDEINDILSVPEGSTKTPNTSREIVGKHKNGSAIYLDMHSIWVSYEGAPALEAILVDVTEQKTIQEQIVSYERLRALGEMASGVAHDFNNVLGTILGRSQLMQRRETNKEVLRGLSIIEKAAHDGSMTVKRIQEFSRVRTDHEFATLDLNAVLEDAIEMTRTRWVDEAQKAGKQVKLESTFSESISVKGNISELRELFINFILNAVDAIEHKGTITISTEVEEDCAVVRLADTGKGMSAAVQRKLFDPFFSTKGSQGTGLGMSIAYGTIQRHRGRIELTTKEGVGTTFLIYLPVSDKKENTHTVSKAESPGQGTGRILVVDDEEDLRMTVTDILEDEGYSIIAAPGGKEALALLKENEFDLMVTDLGMPGMSGWDLARTCRELYPQVSIILLTGWGATLDPEEATKAGIDKIMEKPFDIVELLDTVQDLVSQKTLRKSA